MRWHSHRAPTRGEAAKWPIESMAAAVHPDQITEARQRDRAMGVPTDYTPTGEPILRNPTHRRRYLKSRGFFDKASYC